jgi:hypothetical protein
MARRQAGAGLDGDAQMAADDDFRAGEGMAIEWLEGRSEMSDDLALLVSGDPAARRDGARFPLDRWQRR